MTTIQECAHCAGFGSSLHEVDITCTRCGGTGCVEFQPLQPLEPFRCTLQLETIDAADLPAVLRALAECLESDEITTDAESLTQLCGLEIGEVSARIVPGWEGGAE